MRQTTLLAHLITLSLLVLPSAYALPPAPRHNNDHNDIDNQTQNGVGPNPADIPVAGANPQDAHPPPGPGVPGHDPVMTLSTSTNSTNSSSHSSTQTSNPPGETTPPLPTQL